MRFMDSEHRDAPAAVPGANLRMVPVQEASSGWRWQHNLQHLGPGLNREIGMTGSSRLVEPRHRAIQGI